MEKLMTQNALKTFRFVRLALMAGVGFPLIFASNAFAQLPAPAVPAEPGAAAPTSAEVERVVVTGSNIPTAEETGPNPVDTYRPQDIEKLGIRSATDLQEFIPQQAGGTVNLNIGNAGDGTVQFNLRGLLPKETLVLIDGKRVAFGSLNGAGAFAGPDINLIPFSMVDHVDILKDGASAVYGSDAIAGVVNFFLVHKFRGLEIGGTYGNSNMGASNDMGEWETWIKAGTGDDKTDIVVIADFWQRTGGIFSRDRDISSNGDFNRFGGFDARSGNFPGRLGSFRLIPSIFFSDLTPTPHSAPNLANSPFYVRPSHFGIRTHANNLGNLVPGDGNYSAYNFASITPALPPGDRQVYYGSFTRDLCDKYLTIFGDFKYARSFYDASLAAVPFTPDPFHGVVGIDGTPFPTVGPSGPNGISVPISNPFNPFTVGDTTIIYNGAVVPITTGVRFRGVNDTGHRDEKFTYWDQLFDIGLRGEMGWIADYFKTWNWELGFRYSRNEGQDLSVGEVSQPGLIQALFDTNPATAFNPFGGFNRMNSPAARGAVYVTLHNSGAYELPIYYGTFNGDLFNLPAGPVSFAIGGEYDAPTFDRDRDALNTTFNSIGSTDGQSFRVNRGVWGLYEEVRVPFTSPTWNFPAFYSLEVDFAEREEWYSTNTSAVLPVGIQPFVPAGHSRYNAQKPKVSVRWQPIDPKYIGALTLRGSYTEAFHAPQLGEVTPATSQGFPLVIDPFSTQTQTQIEDHVIGNPNLHPEVAYEWTYGAVWSPKWVKGLTLSADWWHIDMRDIITPLGAQTTILLNPPTLGVQQNGPFVFRGPSTVPGDNGPVILTIDPSQNLSGAIFEGLDYEAIYILDSTIFGGGDWGRITTTINGTWLSRAEFQADANHKRFGIAGEFLPPGFALTSSLPWNRANFSMFYDGPADTWMQGVDVGAIVHWTGQYQDDNASLTGATKLQEPRSGPVPSNARKVAALTTLDLILNYTFNLPPPAPAEVPGFAKDGGKNVRSGKDGKEKNVVPVSTAEYGCNNWRWWLNNTTVTLGMQNVTDEDPPFVAGSFENGYDESLATIKGRFWYVGLKKRF
jgi:outer membrane receptor protein involved in Fe transport